LVTALSEEFHTKKKELRGALSISKCNLKKFLWLSLFRNLATTQTAFWWNLELSGALRLWFYLQV
jgi:hypothetical protein